MYSISWSQKGLKQFLNTLIFSENATSVLGIVLVRA